jgi:gliding motility-associated-like protein
MLRTMGFSQAQFDTLLCVNNQLNGDVLLTLRPPASACPGCTFVGYNIYYATTKSGPYTLFGPAPTLNQANANSFTHINANGNANTYFYYVETVCDCGGVFSYAYSDTLDNRDPVAPLINHVTVNGSSTTINWAPSVSPETYAYVLYYVDLSGNHIIDTIYGLTNTTYTDNSPGRNPTLNSFAYTIAAMDHCNTLGVFNLFPQNTILLKGAQDRCAQTVSLTWNAYKNWPAGVAKYRVFGSLNAGPLQHLGTLNANTNKFTFHVNDGEQWCFEVHAIETGAIDSSISNIICQTISNVQAPLYNQAVSCSVNNNQSAIIISWKADPLADLAQFKILHKTKQSTSYSSLATVNAVPGTSNSYSYSHNGANVKEENNYLIIAYDSCEQAFYGTHCLNGILEGYTTSDNINHLQWSDVALDSMLLDSIHVLRSAANGSAVVINTCLAPCNSFNDDISAFGQNEDELCYTIRYFYHSPQNPFNTAFASISNKWCGSPITEVFFPNSIFPKGNSNAFRPVLTFPDFSEYNLSIYNRYGKVIFQSTNYLENWDGKFNGEFVPAGDYTYILSYTKPNGRNYHQQGNVMVIY